MSKRLIIFRSIPIYIALMAVALGCAAGKRGGRAPASLEEVNARTAKASGFLANGEYQRVIDVLVPIAGSASRDSQVERMLGEAYWRLGDDESSTAHFEDALRINYADWKAHMMLAQMLTESGKTGRALTEFELAIKYSDRDPLAYYNYGLSLYEFGRLDEAIAQWETALSIERNPDYAQALGMGHAKRNDERALEYFELAAELGAYSATFHNNFGLLLTRMLDFERAQLHLSAAVAADSTNDAYRTNLALLYMRAGQYTEAIPQWQSLLETSPDARAPRIYLGQAFYESGRFAEAVEVLEGWLAEQDGSSRRRQGKPGLDLGFDFLAMSYRGLDRLDPALVHIRRAVELAPDDLVHLNNYGVILAESGRITEARAQWTKVLDLEPDNAVARQNLSAFDR